MEILTVNTIIIICFSKIRISLHINYIITVMIFSIVICECSFLSRGTKKRINRLTAAYALITFCLSLYNDTTEDTEFFAAARLYYVCHWCDPP